VESDARFRWCCWSRQTGKSFTKALRRILRGLARRRTQVFLSAGERQSRELMDKARRHCQVLQVAFDYSDRTFFAGTRFRQLEIRLPGGVRIIGLPANPQTARGFTGDVLLDEFAMHADDREIWASMFPTVLRGGGELDVASTPCGLNNMFARLRDNPRFSHSTLTLPDAIDQGLNLDLDEIRRSMGDEELFRQEFLCEFLDEATAFLTLEQIAACEDPALTREGDVDALRRCDNDLFVGVDVGRKRDLTVVWVLAEEGSQLVTRGIFELASAPFREQAALLSRLLTLRNVCRCSIDAGGLGMQLAESAVDEFGPHRVEAVTFTGNRKSEIAGRLRVAVENRRIRIPADERIRRDWHSVRRAVTDTGQFHFVASRADGSHADRFWAAALAVYTAANPPGRAEMLPASPIFFARNGVW
jgi:phage FluMu gp28-like protein